MFLSPSSWRALLGLVVAWARPFAGFQPLGFLVPHPVRNAPAPLSSTMSTSSPGLGTLRSRVLGETLSASSSHVPRTLQGAFLSKLGSDLLRAFEGHRPEAGLTAMIRYQVAGHEELLTLSSLLSALGSQISDLRSHPPWLVTQRSCS